MTDLAFLELIPYWLIMISGFLGAALVAFSKKIIKLNSEATLEQKRRKSNLLLLAILVIVIGGIFFWSFRHISAEVNPTQSTAETTGVTHKPRLGRTH